MNRRFTDPGFWDERYREGRTPWDLGGVPPALTRFLAANPARDGEEALIPGCGSGHEIAAFAVAGYRVTALDFSPAAVERARARLPTGARAEVRCADVLRDPLPAGRFAVVYERTFLCALAPDRWSHAVARLAACLRPGGRWAGLLYFGPRDDGPPFGLAPGEESALFAPWMEPVADRAVPEEESPALFAGRERWQEWRRKAVAPA